MIKRTTIALSLGLVVLAQGQNPPPNPAPPQGLPKDGIEEIKIPGVESNTQKYSYALGTQVGRMMKDGDIAIDIDAFKMAFDDAKANKSAIDDSQIRVIMGAMQNEVSKKQLVVQEAWLAENEKAEGVTQTESGLQYKVLKEGSGPKPVTTDRVVAHYHGTLLDGSVFDSSVKRGAPGEFPVLGVIPGWTEALQLMPTGSKWRLFIPSKLAYGPRGRPGIPPNAMLTFEVELLEIKEAVSATTPPIAIPPKGLPNAGKKPETATTPPVEVPAEKPAATPPVEVPAEKPVATPPAEVPAPE